MAVESKELEQKPEASLADLWFVTVAAFAFGIPLWMAGAFYTLGGWVVGLNWFFDWLGLPLDLPNPSGWWVLLAVPIGIVYSLVEVRANPKRPKRLTQRWLALATVWLIVIITDVGSTFLGIQEPGPRPWPIARWLADQDVAGFGWAALLTFAPEWLMIWAVRIAQRGR